MKADVVSRRYARALFSLGKKSGQSGLDKLAADLDGLVQALQESPKLTELCKNPLFSANEKMLVLGDILVKNGADQILVNFCRLLADKGRLGHLSGIVQVFNDLLDAEKGILRGELITAVELDAEKRKAVLEQLEQQTKHQIILDYAVDPALIGGILLKVGDMVMDGSLRAQLSILKENIKRGKSGYAD